MDAESAVIGATISANSTGFTAWIIMIGGKLEVTLSAARAAQHTVIETVQPKEKHT